MRSFPNLSEGLVDQQFSVSEYELKLVRPRVSAWHGRKNSTMLAVLMHQLQATCFGPFAVVGNRLLENLAFLIPNLHPRAFKSKTLRVAVEFLEQSPAGTECNVVRGPSGGCDCRENPVKRFEVDSVTLDDADLGVQYFKALCIGGETESLSQDV